MSQITDTLEPCPFCRCPVQTIRTNMDTGLQFITCDHCQADGPVASNGDEAALLWNRRSLAAQAVAVKPEDIWDDATNAVCQHMQEQNMCNCADGDCLAAKIECPASLASPPEPQDADRWKREPGVDDILEKYRDFIRERPALTSLLYDIDMLPEQTVSHAGAIRLAGLCEVWRKGEAGELPKPEATE